MKKIFTVFTLAAMIILSACGGGKESINKDNLQGRYQLDLSPILKEAMAEKVGTNDMGSAFAEMFLSQLEVTVQFETEKAIVDASGAAIELIKGLASADIKLPMALGYKIENDSVLYLKEEGKEFEKVGVLSKLGDGYDYLKLSTEKDGKRIEVGMKKIK